MTGTGKSDKEYFEHIDKDFLINPDFHLQYYTAVGKFRVSRNCYNDRCNESSVTDRAQSSGRVGVQDTKVGWLVQSEDPHNDEDLSAIHSATLYESLEEADERDREHKNPNIQISVADGHRHCKLYRREIFEYPGALIF